MDKLKNFSDKSSGILYVVATPIGNLQDISARAIEILGTVDQIICEDTRVTKKLLNKLEISKKLIVYNDHSNDKNREYISNMLKNGQNLAIVSDAGTPLISDPGFKLVEACRNQNIDVTPIPGPSAFVTALSAAGLPSDTFFFGGFFPRTKEKSAAIVNNLAKLETTAIFYESPSRILKSLQLIEQVAKGIKVCVARELTKLYEEFIAGDISDVIQKLKSQDTIRGEIVLILDLRDQNTQVDENIEDLLRELMKQHSMKDSVSIVAKRTGLPKNKVYDIALNII